MRLLSDLEMFSREQLAGYDPDLLAKSVMSLIGAGAAGNNIALNLALAGVGEVRVVDPDTVDRSNLTRSPLFSKMEEGQTPRHKAREVARRMLTLSYAAAPVVRFATKRIEELGLGGLTGSNVVISAADSFSVRAWLADATRLLGIPLVELGFSGSEGHVSVFPNLDADEPCWRCLHPDAKHGGVGCGMYARATAAQGKTPATQPLAATFGAIATEAAILALHGEFPLAGKSLHLDIRDGSSRLVTISNDPACPGAHRLLPEVRKVEVRSVEPLSAVLDALGSEFQTPIVHLPSPFVAQAPCMRCGAQISVQKASWAIGEPPTCVGECMGTEEPSPTVSISTIAHDDPLARQSCRSLGLPICAVFEVEDVASGNGIAVQLAGGPDDLFITKRRKT